MVKATKSLVVIVVLLLMGIAAMAGDYHLASQLICSDCHVMHYSLQHNYTGGVADTLGAGGPYTYLLKNAANDLCLSCHDAQTTAPDVLQTNTNTYVRQAGALNQTGGANPYEVWKGHTLGSTAIAPGGTWSDASGLGCGDCHAVHGHANYRNLKPTAGGSSGLTVTQAAGTNVLTTDVFERDATLGQISTHYGVGNVDFNEPSQTASAVATWCKSCHTNFHGTKGGLEVGGGGAGGTEWLRHPNADANIGAVGGSHSSLTTFNGKTNKVKVMDALGAWNGTTTTVTATCVTCHKGHGNQNAFGLIQMAGSGTVDEQGDGGGARDLCKQCHVQG